jgi:hypothetical protein
MAAARSLQPGPPPNNASQPTKLHMPLPASELNFPKARPPSRRDVPADKNSCLWLIHLISDGRLLDHTPQRVETRSLAFRAGSTRHQSTCFPPSAQPHGSPHPGPSPDRPGGRPLKTKEERTCRRSTRADVWIAADEDSAGDVTTRNGTGVLGENHLPQLPRFSPT